MKNKNETLYRKCLFYAVVLTLATLFILSGVFPASPEPVNAGDTEFPDFKSGDLPPKGNPKLDSAPTGTPAAEPATETDQPASQQQPSGINWVMIYGIVGGFLVLAACISYFTWRRKRMKKHAGKQPS